MIMIAFHFVWVQLLALFAGGLVLLHFSGKSGSTPLKVGGVVLVAGAVLSAVCVLYYANKYMRQGAFESPHPMMMQKMGGMMGRGMMMRPGMMDGGRGGMMDGGMGPGSADSKMPAKPEGISEEEHKAHHPDTE